MGDLGQVGPGTRGKHGPVGAAVRSAALIAAVLAALSLPATASADHSDANLPWPAALPPQEVSAAVQPRPVDNCRRATIRCVDDLLRRLRAQWKPLDRACDHRALWPFAYIQITKLIRADLARDVPRWFPHRKWFTYVVTDFSNRYFRAYADYHRGRADRVPYSWRVTFQATAAGDYHAGQDILLASNAHTQWDLPHAYAKLGMRTPSGETRKPDHDGVNEVNTRVFDDIEDEYARRYDPTFAWVDMKPSPIDELGSQEMVKGWREGAWRNAERLMNARTPEERSEVDRSIATTANAWADFIAAGTLPGHRATRDAHCRAFHAG
ncbi:MAG TPA: DUF5995 family protein [Thermoleophilaceae bacterium]